MTEPSPDPAAEASAAETAIVLFSGGQDSATCLAWALKRFPHVETVGFDYGQRHRVELDCRQKFLALLAERFPQWRERLGPDHLVDLGLLGRISETALTREAAIGGSPYRSRKSPLVTERDSARALRQVLPSTK